MNSSILLGWLNEYWCRIFGSWFNHFGHQVGHILKIYIKPILILLSRSFGQYGQDYLFQMLKQIRGKALKKKIKSESLWFIWDYITTKKILYNWNKFYCKIFIKFLNPTLSGMWNGAGYPGGGHYDPSPLKSARMKLQSHVRGQIRGSQVCPVHLDYF